MPIYSLVSLVMHNILKLYQSIWKFASFAELKRIVSVTGFLGLFHAILITLLFKRMPISYYIVGAAIQFMLVVAVRFAYRFILLERNKVKKLVKESTHIKL